MYANKMGSKTISVAEISFLFNVLEQYKFVGLFVIFGTEIHRHWAGLQSI